MARTRVPAWQHGDTGSMKHSPHMSHLTGRWEPHAGAGPSCAGAVQASSYPARPPAFAGEHKVPVSPWAARICPDPWAPPRAVGRPGRRAASAIAGREALAAKGARGACGRLGGSRTRGAGRYLGVILLGRNGLPLCKSGKGFLWEWEATAASCLGLGPSGSTSTWRGGSLSHSVACGSILGHPLTSPISQEPLGILQQPPGNAPATLTPSQYYVLPDSCQEHGARTLPIPGILWMSFPSGQRDWLPGMSSMEKALCPRTRCP